MAGNRRWAAGLSVVASMAVASMADVVAGSMVVGLTADVAVGSVAGEDNRAGMHRVSRLG